MNRSEINEVRKKLANHWGLSQAQVHVGTKGRVCVDTLTDKVPAEHNGIIFWDGDELYDYLEEQGL